MRVLCAGGYDDVPEPKVPCGLSSLVDACWPRIGTGTRPFDVSAEDFAKLPPDFVPRVWDLLTFASPLDEFEHFLQYSATRGFDLSCRLQVGWPCLGKETDHLLSERDILQALAQFEREGWTPTRADRLPEDADIYLTRVGSESLLSLAELSMSYAIDIVRDNMKLDCMAPFLRRVRARDFSCGLVSIQLEIAYGESSLMPWLVALLPCDRLKQVVVSLMFNDDIWRSVASGLQHIDLPSRNSGAKSAKLRDRPASRRPWLTLAREFQPVFEPLQDLAPIDSPSRGTGWLVIDYAAARADIERWQRVQQAIELAKQQEKNKERRAVERPPSSGELPKAKKRQLAATETAAFGG